jgi:hypothetical protein
MPSFGSRITTTTQDYFLPKAVNTILNSNVFATRMINGAKKFRGETMKFPVIVNATAVGGSFFGYDTLNTNAVDTRVNLSFTPSFTYEPVNVSLTELSANEANKQEQVLDLMALSMQEAAERLADNIGTMFWSDGTGNSSKDFLGLAAAVDDGNSVATYGGQSRSTYTSLASTVTASGGTLTLAKLATLHNAVTSGSQKPTVIYTTEAVWSLYEQLLQPQERITKPAGNVKGMTGGTGFTSLEYRGIPVLKDEKATSGVLAMLNEDFIDFYALPMAMTEAVKYKGQTEGTDYDSPVGLGFSWSGWIKPINQAALVGHIYLGGQLISRNSRRHGKLTGITSI